MGNWENGCLDGGVGMYVGVWVTQCHMVPSHKWVFLCIASYPGSRTYGQENERGSQWQLSILRSQSYLLNLAHFYPVCKGGCPCALVGTWGACVALARTNERGGQLHQPIFGGLRCAQTVLHKTPGLSGQALKTCCFNQSQSTRT